MSATKPDEGFVAFEAPDISWEDLFAFYEAHFSGHATLGFTNTFVEPRDEPRSNEDGAFDEHNEYDGYEEQEEDEDDLGYYPDGVKRTLTDEQIQIFRHSELEALRRRQEKGSEKKVLKPAAGDGAESGGSPHGLTEVSGSDTAKGKRKKKKNTKRMKLEPKPDLRKRTWDVVEAGLDTLDYD